MFRKIIEEAIKSSDSEIKTIGVFVDTFELFEEAVQYCIQKSIILQPIVYNIDEKVFFEYEHFLDYEFKHIVKEPTFYVNVTLEKTLQLALTISQIVYYREKCYYDK